MYGACDKIIGARVYSSDKAWIRIVAVWWKNGDMRLTDRRR